jgi:hypothetical protein
MHPVTWWLACWCAWTGRFETAAALLASAANQRKEAPCSRA